MSRILLVAVAAIPLGLMSPASARALQEPPSWAAPGSAGAQDEVLSPPELRDALEVAGYSDIRILQADGGLYQMSARKDGRPVLLRVNARTRRFSERPAN